VGIDELTLRFGVGGERGEGRGSDRFVLEHREERGSAPEVGHAGQAGELGAGSGLQEW
jgi:hypothetical protein